MYFAKSSRTDFYFEMKIRFVLALQYNLHFGVDVGVVFMSQMELFNKIKKISNTTLVQFLDFPNKKRTRIEELDNAFKSL